MGTTYTTTDQFVQEASSALETVNTFDSLSTDVAAAITAVLSTVTIEAAEAGTAMQVADTPAAAEELVASLSAPTSETAAVVVFNPAEAMDKPITEAINAEAIVFGENVTAQITFAADSPTTTVALGSGGNNDVTFLTSQDVTVGLTGGDKDNVQTGAGADYISYQGGKDVVISTGSGNDYVHLTGGANNLATNTVTVNIDSEKAQQTQVFIDQAMKGAATILGGQGYDQLRMNDTGPSNHTFWIEDGMFKMHSEAELTFKDENLMIWSADEKLDPTDNVTVFAATAGDSLVAKLYQVAFGRSVLDGQDGIGASTPLNGIEFWTNYVDTLDAFSMSSTDNVIDLAYRFLNCKEFDTQHANQNNSEYVADLFTNLNELKSGTDVTTVAGATADQYIQMLDDGTLNRYDVALQLAASTQAVEIMGSDGAKYVIDLANYTNDDIFGNGDAGA